MHKLNRLLNRHNMPRMIGVDRVHHRRKGRRFTRTRRTRHQNQSGFVISKTFNHWGHPQLFQCLNFGRNNSKYRSITVQLLVKIAAEPIIFIHLIGKIEVSQLNKLFPSRRRTDRLEKPYNRLSAQRFLLNFRNLSMASNLRGLTLQQMQIAPALLDQNRK